MSQKRRRYIIQCAPRVHGITFVRYAQGQQIIGLPNNVKVCEQVNQDIQNTITLYSNSIYTCLSPGLVIITNELHWHQGIEHISKALSYNTVLSDPNGALRRSAKESHLRQGTENISKLYSSMYVCVLIDPDSTLGRSKNELHLHQGTANIFKTVRLECCYYRPDAAIGRTTHK